MAAPLAPGESVPSSNEREKTKIPDVSPQKEQTVNLANLRPSVALLEAPVAGAEMDRAAAKHAELLAKERDNEKDVSYKPMIQLEPSARKKSSAQAAPWDAESAPKRPKLVLDPSVSKIFCFEKALFQQRSR